jgi:hypothetical protein
MSPTETYEKSILGDELLQADQPGGRESGDASEVTLGSSAATARLHGFDIDDQPLICEVRGLRREIIRARSTVSLLTAHIGSSVVVLFEEGDLRRPIIMGVLCDRPLLAGKDRESQLGVTAQVDDTRLVLSGEREVVLRCGAASITLTRAGKILIKGSYIVSRSSGYNKIKGAAVDIN